MRYQLLRQEKSYFCVPACLQAVLRNYGEELSQKEIAREINCGEQGVLDLQTVENFLKKRSLDFKFFNYNATPFNEPDFLLSTPNADILIAMPNSKGYHVLLLERFRDPVVEALDPKDSEKYITNIYALIAKMEKEKRGGFGLISRLS